MEFFSGKCPECGGELQVPQDREKIICMYCGKEINTADTKQESSVRPEEQVKVEFDESVYESLRSEALVGMQDMLLSIEHPMSVFSRKTYETNFASYREKYKDILNACMDASIMADSQSVFFAELADDFVQQIKLRLDEISKKREREDRQLDYNMVMVTFFFPALLEEKNKSFVELAEHINHSWKNHFPTVNLELATFERINSGFKRRFCYITTAVCESMHQPDDCYELTVLRQYRDNYLMNTKDGEALVRKYYDVAPSIVKHIDQHQNRVEIYAGIFEDYLSPCISFLEKGDQESCRTVYQKMVETLEQEYFLKRQDN